MGNQNSVVKDFEAAFSRLLSESVGALDDEFWNALFTVSISEEIVKAQVTHDRVRCLRTEQRVNCCTLLKKILSVLLTAVDEGQYTDKALTPTVIAGTETAVRILTRLMPVLLEVSNDSFCNDLFWKPGSYMPAVQREFRKKLSLSAGEEVPLNERNRDVGLVKDEEIILAHELLSALQRLLFLRGYTLSPSVPVFLRGDELPKHRLETEFLWCGGIIAPMGTTPSATNEQLARRAEVLQCLIMCLSSPLYTTQREYAETHPKWMAAVVSGDVPFTATLFCSLIATVFSYDPVGYAIPFSSTFTGDRKSEQRLVEMCLQFLCLVMDVDPSSCQTTPKEKKGDYQQDGSRNVYRTMLSGLNKDAEIGMIFNGLLRLFSTVTLAATTAIRPIYRIDFDQELLIFTWILLTCNSHFLRQISCQPFNSNQLIVPILYILLDASNAHKSVTEAPTSVQVNRDHLGVMHAAAFILLVLSSEREFAIRLNDRYQDVFPLKLPLFQGCHGDLLLLVAHRVAVDGVGFGNLDSLIDMLLTILCNVSAYIKSFCMEAAVKLLSLLERFSRPGWIFKMPHRFHEVTFLLDLINNLIQYQYEGNTRLVYAMLRQRQLFFSLKEITLPSSLVDQVESDSSTTAPTPDNESSPKPVTTRISRGDTPLESWRPTAEWMKAWKSKLQFQAILRLINSLYPKVEQECREKGLIDQPSVLEFLHGTTMVGLLPVPHPIIIRHFHSNAYTAVWWTAFTWASIYSRNHVPKGLVDGTLVALVQNAIQHQAVVLNGGPSTELKVTAKV